MEHRLDFELEREPDYPPEWWDLMLDEEWCAQCNQPLPLKDREIDETECEDCR